MLKRAVAQVKKDKLAAMASFNHNDTSFRDRDLFVFCFNGGDGRFTAPRLSLHAMRATARCKWSTLRRRNNTARRKVGLLRSYTLLPCPDRLIWRLRAPMLRV